MVAIVTGNGTGLERTSAFVLGSNGQLGSSTFGRYGENVTVNAATGNLIINRTDEILIGQGPDAAISSVYNSKGLTRIGVNDTWQLSAQQYVTGLTGTRSTTGSTITLYDADGSNVIYTWNGSYNGGAYVSTEGAGAYDTLTYNATTHFWTWTDGNTGATRQFDDNNSGRIVNAKDTDGNQLTYTYTGANLTRVTVTDASGTAEHTDFTWSGSNVTQIVTTLQGSTLTRTRYTYDAQNRLSTLVTDLSPTDNSITDNNTVVTTYTYVSTTSNLISSISQTGSGGASVLSVTYDASNRVQTFTQTAATEVSNTTTFTYNTNSTAVKVTTPTDSTGQTTTLTYDATSKQLTQIALPPAQTGATAQTLSFGYNSNGDVLTATDGSGNVTTYTYDSRGNALSVQDQLGNKVVRTYDTGNTATANHLLTETQYFVSGQTYNPTTRYAYTSTGDLHYVVSPQGEVTEYVRNTAGLVTSTKVYRGTTYSLTGVADNTAISESALNTWVSGITDKSTVERTDTTYDFRGNVATVTSYTAANSSGTGLTTSPYSVTTYTYDQSGDLLTRQTTGNSGTGTSYTYNTESYLTSAGASSYDGLWRPARFTDINGAVTTTAYTDGSNQMAVTLANGLVKTSVYNWAGQLLSYAETQTGPVTATTNYVYDSLGRLRMATDATGNTTYYLYDNVGRKVADIAADGSITEYRYDQSDRLVATISYATLVTSTNLASLVSSGQPTNVVLSTIRPTANAADIWNWRIYDTANRLSETIDGDGDVVQFTYDGASNLTKTTAFTNVLAAATVTGFKTTIPTTLQTPTTSSTDIVTRNFYDNDSRLIGTLDGDGYLSQIKYDEAGNKVETIAYATIVPSADRAAGVWATLLTDVGTNTADIHTHYVYDDEGNLKYKLDATLRPTEYVYDGAGRVLHTVEYAAPIASAPSTYTVANVLAQITATSGLATNANNQISRSVYDAAGRVAYTIDANGGVVAYTYDAIGEVIKTIAYATVDAVSSDQSLSAMSTWVSGHGVSTDRTTRIFYDQVGRVVFTVDAENYVSQNRYDAAGRLTSTVRYTSKTYSISDSTTTATLATLIGSPPSSSAISRIFYDKDGRVAYTVDAENYVTQDRYDAVGRLTSTVRYTSKTYTISDTTTTATLASQITSVPSDAAVSRIFYDQTGKVVYTVDAENYVTENRYNGLGQLVLSIRYTSKTYAITDSTATADMKTTIIPTTIPTDAVQTSFTYDAAGQLISETNAATVTGEATTTQWAYDAFGRVVTKTDGLNNQTIYTYDNLGHLKTATVPLAGSTTGVTTNYYDAFGNVIQINDARGNNSYFFYDSLDRLIYQVDQEGYVTKSEYTRGNAVAKLTHYAAKLTGTITLSAVQGIATDSAHDEVTIFTRDKRDLVTQTTDAQSYSESYVLDAFGNRTQVTNKLGGITTNTFDKRGLLLSETKAETSITSANATEATSVTNTYTYDSRGNRTQMIEASGLSEARTTNYSYDKLNHLTVKASGDLVPIVTNTSVNTTTNVYPSVDYYYDSRGNLIQTIDEVGAKTFFYYDHLDRKTASVNAVGTLSNWTYDANGNVTTETVYGDAVALPGSPGGSAPSPVNGSNARVTQFAYDKANRLYTTTVSNVQYGEYSGGTFTQNVVTLVMTNAWDAMGNLVGQQDATGYVVHYYYDKRGDKIAQVDQNKYLTYYTLDADGNVTKEERFANAITVAVYNDSDPVALRTGVLSDSNHNAANDRVTNFTYDRNGRRLTEQRVGVVYYTVDPNNHGALSTALTANATIIYTYNGLGEVLTKTEAAGDQTVYTYDTFGRESRMSTASYTDANGATVTPTTWLGYDGLGNLTITEQAELGRGGTIYTSRYNYGAGGRLISFTDANLFTTNYYYDAAGRTISQVYSRTKSWLPAVQEAKVTNYDALGRTIYQGTAAWNGSAFSFGDYTQTQYDTYGDVSATGTNGIWQVTNQYDNAGRLWKTTAGGVTKIFYYDRNGNQTAQITSDGNALPSGYSWAALTIAQVNTLMGNSGTTWGALSAQGVFATFKTYDARGQNVSSVEGQAQLSTSSTVNVTKTCSYNAFGEVVQETDGRGDATTYTYNTLGKLTQTTNPQVNSTSDTGVTALTNPLQINYYDLSGRLVAIKDANGNTISRSLLAGTGYGGSDALVTKEFHPDTGIKTNGYDVFGNLTKVTDEIGNVTLMGYDAMGRMTTLTHPTRAAGTAGNATGSAQTLIDYYSYDGLGDRLLHWNSQLGTAAMEYTDYDSVGRITRNEDMAGHVTFNSYTWDPTISTAIYGGGSLGTFGGWVETTTNPAGLTSTTKVDSLNRTISKTDFGGNYVADTYNLAGELANQAISAAAQASNQSEHIEYRYYNTGLLKSIDDITTTVGGAALTAQSHPRNQTTSVTINYHNQYGSPPPPGDYEVTWDPCNGNTYYWYNYNWVVDWAYQTKTVGYTEDSYTYLATTITDDRHTSFAYDQDGNRTHETLTDTVGNYGTTVYTDDTSTGTTYDYYTDHQTYGNNRTYYYYSYVAGYYISGYYYYNYQSWDPITQQNHHYDYYYNSECWDGTYYTYYALITHTATVAEYAPYYATALGHYDTAYYTNDPNYTETPNLVTTHYNPTTYSYSATTTTLEDEAITVDKMNRVTEINDTGAGNGSWPIDIQTKYDSNGNVRERNSTFYLMNNDGSRGSQTSQDYWYKYDNMNRFTTTMGTLSGGVIGNGTTGFNIAYDAAGNRKTVTDTLPDGTTTDLETYTYTADGFLAEIDEKVGTGATNKIADYALDAQGRATTYKEYGPYSSTSGNVVVYERDAVYDAIGQVNSDTVYRVVGATAQGTPNWFSTQGTYSYVDGSGHWLGGVLVHGSTTATSNLGLEPATDTANTYVWRDSAVLASTVYTTTTPHTVTVPDYWDPACQYWIPGYTYTYGTSTAWTTNYIYNNEGQLTETDIADGQPRTFTYVNNQMGEVLSRDVRYNNTGSTVGVHDRHYYLAGQAVGDVSSDGPSRNDYAASIAAHTASVAAGSGMNPTVGYVTPNGYGPFQNGSNTGTPYANFDQSYDPITGYNSATTATNYTVHAGDTLSSVALAVWGDASLWYLIAQANGLQANSQLQAGQSLIIPNNQVHNFHNSAATFKVYDPNVAYNDTAPTAPEIPPPPPPPPSHHGGCGGFFGSLIKTIISFTVAILTTPFVGPVAGAMLGDAAGQAFGIATGMQDGFSWKELAVSGITAGVAKGLSMPGLVGQDSVFEDLGIAGDTFGEQFAQGAISNTISQGIGVATGLQSKFDWTGVAAAGMAQGVGSVVGGWLGTSNVTKGWDINVRNVVSGVAGTIAYAATRSLIEGSDFGDNILAGLPTVLGNTIGNMAAGQINDWATREAAGNTGGWSSKNTTAADDGENGDSIEAVTAEGVTAHEKANGWPVNYKIEAGTDAGSKPGNYHPLNISDEDYENIYGTQFDSKDQAAKALENLAKDYQQTSDVKNELYANFLTDAVTGKVSIVDLVEADSPTGFKSAPMPAVGVYSDNSSYEWSGDWHLHPASKSVASFGFSDADYNRNYDTQNGLFGMPNRGSSYQSFVTIASKSDGTTPLWTTYSLPQNLPKLNALTKIEVDQLSSGKPSVNVDNLPPQNPGALRAYTFLLVDPQGNSQRRVITPGIPIHP